ncbi:hypothetical protein [Staphylococcus phage SAP6]|uniref:Uncharacterized protein n=2 Tax=Silviavirus remus TaxID=1857890 RepID=S4T8W7_9CAUD|nr:hypothetical protein QLX36_gp109 [Staphylococcus phage vB_SauM_Romulus]YP_008431256.1 hypothetical protein O151_gp053 [Staphylococcus phage vB_SauM_Remus]APC43031.1 hypothetical protein SAP1_166 [Staphylococcus phage StAP1]UVD42714.1 hypothetical protein [Staphylococcus phage vB_SauM-V1SA22]WAW12084.1 hypothetical protein [Staphylococcus phage SAP6]WBF47832.1 hypothetical protein SSP49_07 [Staphylococcus phage SSP49]AFV81016.1 hypothetical protein Remus_137 [Staphylococcus phage vB_SauM_Re
MIKGIAFICQSIKRNNDIETIKKLEKELQELYKRVID